MILSIQYLRALACCMVLLSHISFKLKVHSINHLEWFKIGELGVDLFFIISGFIMCLTADQKENRFLDFMTKRLLRVIPIYWILTSVALIVYIYSPSLVNSSGGSTSVIYSYLLLPTPEKYLINNGWTLSYEFYFYLLFSMCLFAGKWDKLLVGGGINLTGFNRGEF